MHKKFILFVAVILVMFSGAAAVQADVAYFIEAGGVVSMEAENYSANNGYVLSNAGTVVSPDHGRMDASNFSGTGYMSTNRTGVQMDYVIEFTTTGTYYVTLRSLAGGHYENGFCAKFDNHFVVGYCDTRGGHGINTAKWAKWAWVSRAQYPHEPLLRGCVMINVTTPGKHTFSILQRESLAWLDKIVLRLTSLCQQDHFCQGCFSDTKGPPESERSTDPKSSPTATTGVASSVSSESATLNGTVNPNDASSAVVFAYGKTNSYGSTVAATQSPLSGSTAQAVSAQISSLTPATTYHFRVQATSSGGTDTGEDQTFITKGKATTCTGDAPVIQNVTFAAGDVYRCTAATSITFGSGVTIESGATVDLTAPLVKGVDGVTVKEGANLTITTP